MANVPQNSPGTFAARHLAGEHVVHIPDLLDSEVYRNGDPGRRAMVELGGARSAVSVSLLNDQAIRGGIAIYRQEARPFSEKEIALLENFAAQAVIAMENARLLGALQARTEELAARNSAFSEQIEHAHHLRENQHLFVDSSFDKNKK